MKKIVFGIFAHPDDEAFGPSAYLYHLAQNDTDVHLIVATDGEAGTNIDNIPNLGEVRLQEWEESRKRMKATSGHALHYPDGGLCNNLYLKIANDVTAQITSVCEQYNEPLLIDFLTFYHDGVSGHLDHIAISFITTYVYLTLQKNPPKNSTVEKLRYYCLPEVMIPQPETSWIYMAKGKPASEIDEIFDFETLVEKKLYIMQAHHTQRKDMEDVILAHQNQETPSAHCDHFRYYK